MGTTVYLVQVFDRNDEIVFTAVYTSPKKASAGYQTGINELRAKGYKGVLSGLIRPLTLQ